LESCNPKLAVILLCPETGVDGAHRQVELLTDLREALSPTSRREGISDNTDTVLWVS
jgi:hypothetical protein